MAVGNHYRRLLTATTKLPSPLFFFYSCTKPIYVRMIIR